MPGRIVTTSSADVPLKGLVHLVEALAKVRTEHPDAHLVVVGKRAEDGPVAAGHRAATASTAPSSSSRASRDAELVDLVRGAQIACVPSLYEGFSLPAAEAMATGTPLVATTGGAIPEVAGPDGETCLAVPPGRRGRAGRRAGPAAGRRRRCAARLGAAGRERVLARFTWAQAAERHRRALPRGDRRARPPRSPAAAPRRRRVPRRAAPRAVRRPPALRSHDRHAPTGESRTTVLTVDFSRFPLAPGDRVLDLGCGAGRHAFECYRRGAQVVALDQNGEEIREVAKWFAAMKEAGEAPAGATATAMEGDALALPFPDDSPSTS